MLLKTSLVRELFGLVRWPDHYMYFDGVFFRRHEVLVISSMVYFGAIVRAPRPIQDGFLAFPSDPNLESSICACGIR